MFRNHLKIAWRSLKSQPFFSFLNTFGLAVGMAGGLLIALYIVDEFSYDKMFADADRIHRIDMDMKFGGAEMESAQTPAPMAAALENDFSQVGSTVRFRNQGSMLVRKNRDDDNVKELQTTYVDSNFFDMFGIDLLDGDARTALTQPNTLVLTRTAAEKHFGTSNAVGQNVLINNTDTYTVTGVIDDLPENSYFRGYSVFMAMAGYSDSRNNYWAGNNYYTFIKLVPGFHADDLYEPLQGMVERYMLPWAQTVFPGITAESFAASGNYIRYHTIPLTDIHLHSARDYEMNPTNTIQNVYILSFIGLFLILLACVNFMNLSTAHSLRRAKEVGIRKTLGSKKSDLIRQFLTESGLLSFGSLLVALIVVYLVLPFFNDLAGKSISIPLDDPVFWLTLLVTTFLLGLLSGSYPAFFMSRFMPVKTLKGGGATKVGGSKVRSTLVVFQFVISVFLIVSTLVVFQQLKFIQNKDLGYAKDQVLLIYDTYAAGNQLEAFKEEVDRMAQVKSSSLSSFLPVPSSRSNNSFFAEGAPEQENAIQMSIFNVDEEYMPTLDMELVAGRNFDPEYPTDSSAVIINEATLKELGVPPDVALGMRIYKEIGQVKPVFYTIIGVMKNFNFESLRENIGALGLFLGTSTGSLMVKLSAGNFESTISHIESTWNKLAPGQPFNYRFMEDSFNATFEAEQRLGKIFMVFTILSILIACLGLFGLAAFNAKKRTKEIGIRKVLGASVGQITYRLTTDFLKLVGIAILISLPIGWYAMNQWLEDFAYRIEIGWWVLGIAALLAVGIAILTVGYQSIKAAMANPATALQNE